MNYVVVEGLVSKRNYVRTVLGEGGSPKAYMCIKYKGRRASLRFVHTVQKMNFSIKNFFSNFEETFTRFFYKQPSCEVSNVKNGLKVKQLAKQPPTLKTLIKKILVEF